MSFDLEFVKYTLAYPGRNGFNREIRDTLLNRDKKSLSGIWFLPKKAGSVSKVTEDLSLENLRQELEVEKA